MLIHIAVVMSSKIMVMMIIMSIIRVFRSGSWEALPPLPYPVADACMVCLNHQYYANEYDEDDDIDDNGDNYDDNLKKAVTTIGGRRRLWLMGGSDYPQRLTLLSTL